MGKLLEKILSPVKTFVAAAVITAAVAGMPSEAQGKTAKGTYEYFTQSRNITTGHLISPPEKGKIGERGYGEIKALGNYQERSRAPRTREDILIEVEQENNELSVRYSCQPKKFNERLPVYEQMLREDSVNTHVYFLLPGNVTPLKEIQILRGINNRTMKEAMHIGTPFDETQLCEAIKNINIAAEEGAKPRDCDMQELERAYDNTADAIGGGIGTGMKGLKKITKWGMARAEKKRIKKIKETYGEDYQIHKMPFHQIDGPVFKYTYYGRSTSLFLDTSEVVEGDKAYIVIPQLSFTQDVAGTTRKASLENLAYEIPLEVPKVAEIFKKYSPEEMRNILNGKWNSLEGNRAIEIDFDSETFKENGMEKERIFKHEMKSSNRYQLILGEDSKEISLLVRQILGDYSTRSFDQVGIYFPRKGGARGFPIKILFPNIIKERNYFVKEGTKIEKLDSLEDLAGTWKFKEAVIKTQDQEKQEELRSAKIVIKNDRITYESMENGELEIDEGCNLNETNLPVIKINSLYFTPEESRYNGFVIKINNDNLLSPEDNISLIRVSP